MNTTIKRAIPWVLALFILLAGMEWMAARFVWNQLDAQYRDAPPGALRAVYIGDHDYWWRVRPNLEAVRVAFVDPPGYERAWLDEPFYVSTDEAGLRLTPEAPTGAPRVLALGDSTTFGYGAADDETWPAHLARILAEEAVRIDNAGVPGHSAFQGTRAFEGRWRANAYDVVIITFGYNDARVWDGFSDPQHAEQFAPISTTASGPWAWRVATYAMNRLGGGDAFTPRAPDAPRLSPLAFRAQLAQLVRAVRAAGAVPILLVWPRRGSLAAGATPDPYAAVQGELAKEQDVARVDLRDLGSAQLELLYIDAVHVGPAGNAAIAELLAPAVRDALNDAR